MAGSYICFVTCIFCLVRWVSTPCALKHDGKWTLNFEGVQTWICPLGCSLFWDVRGCNGCPNAKSPWKIGWFIVEPSESCLLIKAIFGVVFPLHKPYIQLLLSLGRRQQCNRPMLHWWHTILFDNSFEAQKFSLLWGKRLFSRGSMCTCQELADGHRKLKKSHRQLCGLIVKCIGRTQAHLVQPLGSGHQWWQCYSVEIAAGNVGTGPFRNGCTKKMPGLHQQSAVVRSASIPEAQWDGDQWFVSHSGKLTWQ